MADELVTGYVADVYLQSGYRAGFSDDMEDATRLTALHGPGGTFICTMVESVIAGDLVAVERHGIGAVGRNARPDELEQLRKAGLEV
jgi:hypothetical protein